MSSHIAISAVKNCYALTWSYGEICVHSNCCGRLGKGLKMWQARLHYHKESLKEHINFNQWAEDKETREIQDKNNQASIKYCTRKIKLCQKRIKQLKENHEHKSNRT